MHPRAVDGILHSLADDLRIMKARLAELPPSRELSLAMTKLDESRLWLDEDRFNRSRPVAQNLAAA